MEFPFIRDHEQARIFSSQINPLLRSILWTNVFTLLDGVWHFALDSDEQGVAHCSCYRACCTSLTKIEPASSA